MTLGNVFVRLKNDINGNPRYYVGAYDLSALVGVHVDQLPQFAGKAGFHKYCGKRYGTGYVVVSYNLDQSLSYLKAQLEREAQK